MRRRTREGGSEGENLRREREKDGGRSSDREEWTKEEGKKNYPGKKGKKVCDRKKRRKVKQQKEWKIKVR